jgi:hypothetical protein
VAAGETVYWKVRIAKGEVSADFARSLPGPEKLLGGLALGAQALVVLGRRRT